jgi:hypothetical protein
LRVNYVRFLHKLLLEIPTMKETQGFVRKLKANKRQSNYELIKSLIASLKSSEYKFAKNYLMMLHNAEGETVPLKLFRYIKEFPEATEQDARTYFSENGITNFDKTVTSLKKRLCWSLVSEYNTQREDGYSEKWRTTFEVMTNLMAYHVLINRQNSAFAFDLLNETINKAKEVEAYSELVFALELKIRHIKYRSESRQVIQLEDDLTFYKKCDAALNDSSRLNIELLAMTRLQGYSDDKKLIVFEKGLKTLEEHYKETNSDSILYYCHFFQAVVYQIKEDYSTASKTLVSLIKLIEKSPALNRKQNLSHTTLDIAENSIYLRNFDIAKLHCKKAKSYLTENSFNYLQCEFIEFYILFYTNQFYLAEKKITGILSNKNYRESEFAINTKKYLLACSLFAQAKYHDALTAMLNLEKVWKDTTGWNIGIRILIMLCYKMLGNYELLAVEKERFRGLSDRYRHRTGIRERDKLILKIMNEFLKKETDFRSIYERKIVAFKKFKTPAYSWKILSHEMIDFEQWFLCMMNKKTYLLEV